MNEETAVCERQTAGDSVVEALSDRFAARGLVRAVLTEAQEQVREEEKTRALAPEAYRLSLMQESTVRGIYKNGKETMSGADLIRYAQESLVSTRKGKDYAECPSVYETADATGLEPASVQTGFRTRLKQLPAVCRALPATAVQTVKEHFPLWFDPQKPDTSANRKKFPVSAFAAIAAIAVSMALIVASALMVTSAETGISRLNSEISTLSSEIVDLRSDLESECDLMEIRRIAVEEYGMVEQDFIRMRYIELDSTEEIEAFGAEEDHNIGLSALLSAIGLKK